MLHARALCQGPAPQHRQSPWKLERQAATQGSRAQHNPEPICLRPAMPGPQTRLGGLGRAQLQKYQKALPIQEGFRKSWLVSVKLANGKEQWRCKLCCGHRRRDWPQSYGQNGVAPNTARLSNFLRHARTAQHVAATQAYLSGLPAHAGGAPISSKPCGSASPGNGVGEEKGFERVVPLRGVA